MRSSGVLRAKRDGNRVYYSTCCADVERILEAAEAIASHCALCEMDALAETRTKKAEHQGLDGSTGTSKL